jgi:Domain of unknown function (DUF4159)
MPPARRMLLAVAVLACVAAAARAQRFRFGRSPVEPEVHNVLYDGRFTFARLKFTTGAGGYYYRGLPAWAHGYGYGTSGDVEVAGRNLVSILQELTTVGPRLNGNNVFALDDPELFKYPVAYMAEADYWVMSDAEAVSLRAYLQKGGFLIFDDFRDDGRDGYQGWANFEANMRRVIPDGRFIDLDPSSPIFHAFYDIDSFDIIPQYYDAGKPVLRGLFEDNDPNKRMIAMINFNTDVSNFWEYSGEGFLPIELSNEAYKLGVNYIVYGLTH